MGRFYFLFFVLCFVFLSGHIYEEDTPIRLRKNPYLQHRQVVAKIEESENSEKDEKKKRVLRKILKVME